MSSQGRAALELQGIHKRFGPQVALDNASFDVRRGEVHALLGENGAGKSTLMNIAAGILRPDRGVIAVDGEEVVIRTPKDAFGHGIGMVHQQYRLVAGLTVAENLHLGWDTTPRLIRRREIERRTSELSLEYGLGVDPAMEVARLSIGAQQRTAILRALVRGARTLILDEPTSVLTPQETTALFATIASLKADGIAIVFITHKLAEVLELADRVSVLRKARNVATVDRAECTARDLAVMMVGSELNELVRSRDMTVRGRPVLDARHITTTSDGDDVALRDITLVVREQEVLGVAGVSGNGQRELAEVLSGMRRPQSGSVYVDSVDLTAARTDVFSSAEVGHIPEALATGVALAATVEANVVIKTAGRQPFSRRGLLSRREVRRAARGLLRDAGLEDIDPRRAAATLSGGQAQRLLVHREMRLGRRLLVAVHPTRGLDVSATAQVHQALLDVLTRRASVILISEDLDELMSLSDRIAVLYRGQITAIIDRQDFDREQIGLFMGGMPAAAADSAS